MPSFKGTGEYYREWMGRLFSALIPGGASVLQLGCGDGRLLAALKPSRGVGVDADPQAIEHARRSYPELRFEVQSADSLYPGGETFDFVVMADLLISVGDLLALFDRARTFCHASTRLCIASHNAAWQGILSLAERLGLRTPAPHQRNWLGRLDIANLCHLADYSLEGSGTTLLVPVALPFSDAVNHRLAPVRPDLPRERWHWSWPLHWIQYFVARPRSKPQPQPLTCSLIVPTRNEVGNVRACVETLPELGAGTEILFVDGQSTDGTVEAIEKLMEEFPQRRIRLIHQVEREDPLLARDTARAQRLGTMLPQGKADAVRKGFLAASGDVLMIVDADLTVPPEDLPRFYEAVATGKADFINGSRLLYPMEAGAMRYVNRLGNKFFSLVFSWLLGQYVKDTLCGTKVLRRQDYPRILDFRAQVGDFDPFGDFELLFGAAASGLSIVDLPVHYRARSHGQPKIENVRHSLLLFRMIGWGILRLKLNRPAGDTTLQQREREHFDRLVERTGEVWWGHQTRAGEQRLRRRGELVRQALSSLVEPRVLELGCGAGALSQAVLEELPGLQLTGCDVSPRALEVARRRCERFERARFEEGDATALPYPDRSFDAIIGNAVLHHLPLECTLRECRRVLEPGGMLWFSEPNMLNPQVALTRNVRFLGRLQGESEDETAFLRWKMERALREAGFAQIEVTPYDFLHPLVPAALISWTESLGQTVERVPLLREFSGSLRISARLPGNGN